jgi:hypothetical protein
MTETVETAPRPRTPLWAKILLALVVLALIVGAALGGVAVGTYLGARETRDVQIVKSIVREEQVVLVTTGLADVIDARRTGLKLLPGLTLPGSERQTLIRYDFDAKFGIEGRDVTIEPTGTDAYLLSIPEFVFLGYENPVFTVVSENNGILSWTTPEIDNLDVVERKLTDEAVTNEIDGIRPLLEEQARTFYTDIITAIDPGVTLAFEFAG